MTSSGPAFELIKTWCDQGEKVHVVFTGKSASVNLKGATLQEVNQSRIVAANADNTFAWVLSAPEFLYGSRLVTVKSAGESCTFSI